MNSKVTSMDLLDSLEAGLATPISVGMERLFGAVICAQAVGSLSRAESSTVADSGKAGCLRCEIRERLLDFFQKEHAASLPRIRVGVETSQDSRAAEFPTRQKDSP